MNRKILEEGIVLEDYNGTTPELKLDIAGEDLMHLGDMVFDKLQAMRIRGFIDMWYELDDQSDT